jgi:2-alkenal reductase
MRPGENQTMNEHYVNAQRVKAILFGLFAIVFLSACSLSDLSGALTGSDNATEDVSNVPVSNAAAEGETVSAEEIADTVLAEVQAELAALQQNAAPTPDVAAITEQITADVLAQIEAQIASEEDALQLASAPVAPEITGADLQAALISLYERTNSAVVYVIVEPLGTGSGFVYRQDGYIVTNNHVVGTLRAFEVVFSNGERRQASLVGTDVDSDLAVIKVDSLPEGVTPLPLAESGNIQVGQFVVAIGNPFGEQGSMSLGIVSGLNRSLPSQRETELGSTYSLPEVIQTDAPINPGNSGGPLLNLDGEVVGINSAIATTTGTNSGVGFAIPVAAVARIVPSLIANGEYEYPYLGAAFDGELSLEDMTTYGIDRTQGAYVVSVVAGGPADQAGIQAADPNTGRGGDLIVALDGVPINDFSDLNSYLSFNASPGQTIEVTVVRNGELVDLELVLGARP